MQKQTLGEVRN